MPVLRRTAQTLKQNDRLRLVSFDREETFFYGKFHKFGLNRVGEEITERTHFNLESDPGEAINLALDSEGLEAFEESYSHYRSWREAEARLDSKYRVLLGEPELSDQEAAELSNLGYGE